MFSLLRRSSAKTLKFTNLKITCFKCKKESAVGVTRPVVHLAYFCPFCGSTIEVYDKQWLAILEDLKKK